jgi:hypothetical protein
MNPLTLAQLYGGSEVTWFPDWLANVWRILLWLATVWWIIDVFPRLWTRGVETGTAYWARYALLLLFLRSSWAQAHNWNQPIGWDTLPITTLALACTYMASYRYKHPAPQDPNYGHERPEREHDNGQRRRATDQPAR